jgi:hypothetical protein
MAGFMPAIHVLLASTLKTWMPSISAFTRVFDALCAGMTRNLHSSLFKQPAAFAAHSVRKKSSAGLAYDRARAST